MRMTRPGRSRVAAAVLAAVAAGASLGATSATADPTPTPDPSHYIPSELVPNGDDATSPTSGYVGDPREAPEIESYSPTFGRRAAEAGVGLRSHRYSSLYGNASTLDVYTPSKLIGRVQHPTRTVVLVHGGAWQFGDRIDLESKAVQMTKQLGVVVVSVNYRLATEAAWPAQRDDVEAAIRYLRQNAGQLNVDPNRMVLLGSSAGGQIAAAVATNGAGKKRFRGLVTLSGLVSPLLMVQEDPEYADSVVPDKLMRCLPGECPERYESATAFTSLDERDAPALLFHSQYETPWDPAQAQQFADTSNSMGVPCGLIVLPGELHGIDAWKTVWPILKPWLQQRLGHHDRVA